MKDSKIKKFENSLRLKELAPENTLIKVGFKDDMVLCDIGAGTGIFSFPAAQITNNTIYALDISDTMIELLEKRKSEKQIKNLEIKKVDSDILPFDDKTCDMAIMVTVFHELEDKELMLNEIKRILKEKGKLMIVEFHKRETPMGPPFEHRISQDVTERICTTSGFEIKDRFELGDNYYILILEN